MYPNIGIRFNSNLVIFVLLNYNLIKLSNPYKLTSGSYVQPYKPRKFNSGIFLNGNLVIFVLLKLSVSKLSNPSKFTSGSYVQPDK
jgi:hypothetical protein